MSINAPNSRYDVSPEAALAAICVHEGPLLIDLDETLYLRNSTEDFIDCARPSLLALLVLRSLEVVKPWRWTGPGTRDNWRLGVIVILFPWTNWRWRAQAPRLAARHTNMPLRSALEAHPQQIIILTNGFRSIVAPLISAMGLVGVTTIGSRIYNFEDRRGGKLLMASRALGDGTLQRCLALTDSIGDIELLERCACALRTVWPHARYRRAFSGVYLPGQYISQIKHPGERYIVRSILQEDFAFWLLSSVGLADSLITHTAGLLLLLLSFWAIYERGYVDNDQSASRNEDRPVLNAAFGRTEVATPTLQPWIWALVAGAAGNIVLHGDAATSIVHFVLWSVVLFATYGIFLLYNRIDKMSRVWIYPFLQFARGAAFVVVVPIEIAGAAALAAHVFARWVPYQVYRFASVQWPKVRVELTRLILFLFLITLIVFAVGYSAVATWIMLALLGWNVFRARDDIYSVIKSARRIDRRPVHVAPDSVSEHSGVSGPSVNRAIG